MYYGYCRVSTSHQSIERQQANINAWAQAQGITISKVYSEAGTGTTMARPELLKLLKRVQAGDTIVTDEVSRLARCADEGFLLYTQLFDKGVDLVFLKQMSINTDHFRAVQQIACVGDEIADTFIEATNKVLLILAERQVRAAFDGAEKEVTFLHKRTSEGMKASGAAQKISATRTGSTYETERGKEIKALIRKHSKVFGGKLTDTEIMTMLTWKGKNGSMKQVSRQTYYKYKAELIEAHKAEVEAAARS